MRWLSQYQGALTQSRLDRAVVARYFAFLVISQLIIFTLIGVAFSSFLNILRGVKNTDSYRRLGNTNHQADWAAQELPRYPEQHRQCDSNFIIIIFQALITSIHPELPATINQTYINQASYWLTFFPYVTFLQRSAKWR